MSFHVPERFRCQSGLHATTASAGNNGVFLVTLKYGTRLRVVASDGGLPGGPCWEHVSVSRSDRCPLWSEMCEVKAMFWSEDDVVVQYHPARRDYVNNHGYCLHMWRPVELELPVPPSIMVGIAGMVLT